MAGQNDAAAERSAHVERGERRIPGESFLVEVRPGVFQIKAVAVAEREIARLRAALEKIAHSADYDSIISPDGDRHQQAIDIALATLEGSNG